ncbi:FkbM family methyltransferase [Streptacidiphilus sp. EB129]|uniref:FkbM family methyltransferase n=1 Tax=Streptacidiphilus sp. EB129 TaxID=3156262 RepID=UPI00351153BE
MIAIGLVELDEGFSCYGLQTDGAVQELKAIYAEMFTDHTYLRHGITVPANGCVLDVGANVGIFSLYVKRHWPQARIVAFEPMPRTLQALRSNLELHHATDVEVVPHGLSGDFEGPVTFTFYPNLPGNSTRYPDQKKHDRDHIASMWGDGVGDHLYQGEDVTVTVERLSTALARYPGIDRVDLLKVDVEGAELDVLQGIDDADWQRIDQIVLELQDLEGTLDRAMGMLTAHGFSVRTEAPAALAHLDYYTVYAVRS